MIVLLFAVQACLWAHAATLVQAAASSGEQTAMVVGATPLDGEHEAETELRATGSAVVVQPSVRAQELPGGLIEVQVSGRSEAILPWLHLPVSATRIGVQQEFRGSE